jgi:RNA polymerase sigma factor (sigma-70 family)
MIATARSGDSRAGSALQELCGTYWYPLYAFLRRSGRNREDAEDLTQGFFASLLSNNRLQLVDAGRGRFRTFLLSSLDHFVIGQWRKETSQKRGGGQTTLSLDFEQAESRFGAEPVDHSSPQQQFDRAWAVELLHQAIRQLGDEYRAAGKENLFEKLSPFLAGPEEGQMALVAGELNLSAGAVRVALHRLRQRYRQKLRDLVGHTVADEKGIDEEIIELFRALGGGDSR